MGAIAGGVEREHLHHIGCGCNGPVLAPGTGTLEPDGLSFSEIDGLLKGVTSKGHLVGMDVVEVNPMRDSSTRTEQTAIRLLIDTLGAAFH